MVVSKPGANCILLPALMNDIHILISFAREEPALLLANYLQQQNIAVHLQYMAEQNTPYCLCLQDKQQMSEAHQLTRNFLDNPTHAKYQQAAWQNGSVLQSQTSLTASLPNVSDLLRVPLTSLILLCALVVFALMQLGWQQQVLNYLYFQPVASLITTGEWWRLFSPIILHFSGLHIVFNLLWWWVLGRKIELLLGSKELFCLLLLSALFSNYGQFIASGANFGGLSGVVYAVMGFVWFSGWLKPEKGLLLAKPLVGFMLVWLVLGYADILWVNMANTAHTLGLVVGCGYAWLKWRK